MKRPIFLFVLLAAIGVEVLQSCNQTKANDELGSGNAQALETSIERGHYLLTLMDCNTCHTPKKMTAKGPVPDMERMLSGYPANDPLPEINRAEIGPGKWVLFHQDLTATVGPWGVSFAANITPHESGIGNWTFEHFKKSMQEGKHKGLDNGRMVLPPMPWQSFAQMADEDLRAIYDYLHTLPPVENIVPAPIPPNELL